MNIFLIITLSKFNFEILCKSSDHLTDIVSLGFFFLGFPWFPHPCK